MFLHGDWGQLLGNMLFPVAPGALVEGPLGAGLFTFLYLNQACIDHQPLPAKIRLRISGG
ncbi:rhomboid family intramembrane serine protease [Pseudomarimonas arenosa]